MKRYYRIAVVFNLFFLSFCCNVSAVSSNLEECHAKILDMTDNKFYVEPGTIYISPKEILLNVSGEFLPVKNLFSDDKGIFVLAEEILIAKSKESPWICAWCGQDNYGGNYCTTCYKLRREKHH